MVEETGESFGLIWQKQMINAKENGEVRWDENSGKVSFIIAMDVPDEVDKHLEEKNCWYSDFQRSL
jgi:hypothetical protein